MEMSMHIIWCLILSMADIGRGLWLPSRAEKVQSRDLLRALLQRDEDGCYGIPKALWDVQLYLLEYEDSNTGSFTRQTQEQTYQQGCRLAEASSIRDLYDNMDGLVVRGNFTQFSAGYHHYVKVYRYHGGVNGLTSQQAIAEQIHAEAFIHPHCHTYMTGDTEVHFSDLRCMGRTSLHRLVTGLVLIHGYHMLDNLALNNELPILITDINQFVDTLMDFENYPDIEDTGVEGLSPTNLYLLDLATSMGFKWNEALRERQRMTINLLLATESAGLLQFSA